MTAQAEDTASAQTSAQTPGDNVLITAKIKPGQADAVRETIAKGVQHWVSGDGFLTKVGTVHFARFLLLDDETLVFEAHFDGTIEDYLDDFYNAAQAENFDLLFRYTEGWPGPHDRDGFMNFWLTRRAKDLATYCRYPGVTCTEIEKAVRVRHNMEAVLEDFQ